MHDVNDQLPNLTPVRTRKPAKESNDWTPKAKETRRWGVEGKVIDYSDANGLRIVASYHVDHKDGTTAFYERRELIRTDVLAHTKVELREMLAKMEVVSSAFYGPAAMTGVHAFIEFCGLMKEFEVICHAACEAGIDFTQANTHTNVPLPVMPCHAAYLAEKLNCIYGPALLADERVRRTFIDVLFGGAYVLQPSARALAAQSQAFTEDGGAP